MSVTGGRRPSRSKPGRRPPRDAEATRARILETATECFAFNGFADTPNTLLAKRASVTSGMLYYYFDSKSKLYEAVAAEASTRLKDRSIDPLLAIISGQATLESRLRTLVNVLVHRAGDDALLYRLSFASDQEADHFPAVAAFRDGVREHLRRLYLAVAGLPLDADPTPEQAELLGFIELLTLGLWRFSLRPKGLERLIVFVHAFDALLDDKLLGDTTRGRTRRPGGRPAAVADLGEDAHIRDRILAIALHHFARTGYVKTSVKEIAAEVGVTTGTVYYHFHNKMELYKEVGNLAVSRMVDGYRHMVPSSQPRQSQRQRVLAWFDGLGATVHEYEDNHWMSLSLALDAARHPPIAEIRAAWAHDIEAIYQAVGGTRPDPDADGWDRDPLVVALTVFSHGASWVVVRNGPDALPPAIRGLKRFLAPGAAP